MITTATNTVYILTLTIIAVCLEFCVLILPLGVKRPGLEANHSPPSSA
jgi:hypothetical protein